MSGHWNEIFLFFPKIFSYFFPKRPFPQKCILGPACRDSKQPLEGASHLHNDWVTGPLLPCSELFLNQQSQVFLVKASVSMFIFSVVCDLYCYTNMKAETVMATHISPQHKNCFYALHYRAEWPELDFFLSFSLHAPLPCFFPSAVKFIIFFYCSTEWL